MSQGYNSLKEFGGRPEKCSRCVQTLKTIAIQGTDPKYCSVTNQNSN